MHTIGGWQIAQEVGHRDAAGFGKEPARGVCAGRVRERRLIASELAEGPLQCCERHDRQLARRSLRFARVISFERCREPLVEPCRDTTRGQTVDVGRVSSQSPSGPEKY